MFFSPGHKWFLMTGGDGKVSPPPQSFPYPLTLRAKGAALAGPTISGRRRLKAA